MNLENTDNAGTQLIPETKLRTFYLIIILLYAFVPVFTPYYYTLDSNGIKFLALAILNLLSYLFLLSQKEFRSGRGIQKEFFTRSFGLIYLLFLFISLLSFFKAINIFESIIQFSKTFTVFSSVFILFLIFKTDKRYFREFMIIMVFVLVIDCLSVFYEIVLYINGRIKGIEDIKSVYANKNILASAIFLKTPIAMWLLLYGRGKWKKIGWVVLLFAFLSTFFLSARAFYLGLILLTLACLTFSGIRFFRSRDKRFIKFFLQYISALLIAIIIFSFLQAKFYPSKKGQFEKSLSERLGSITGNIGSNGRIRAWVNSLELIKDNPLLGVGTGNWKIAELKMENQSIPDYSYEYKSHNDFLEITAETGLFGGVLYITLFVIPFVIFFRKLKSNTTYDEEYFFLPVSGLLCYCVDAFFNFPADRTEIQGLFSVYLASGMCFYSFRMIRESSHNKFRSSFITLFIILMTSSIFILVSNFISSNYQRIAREDIEGKKFRHSAEYMISGFPVIPKLDVAGAPISVITAVYLLHEGKYNQIIVLLKNDRSSPYDSRPEYFMALAYEKLGDTTNELSCLRKMLRIKPFYYNGIRKICGIHENRKEYQTAIKYIKTYLTRQKQNKDAWLYASILWEKSGNLDKALIAIDTSLKYFPGDTVLTHRKTIVNWRMQLKPYETQVNLGLNYSKNREYSDAIKCFTDLLNRDSHLTALYEYRGECFYFTNDYTKCIADLDIAIQSNPFEGSLYNFRGVCLHLLGQDNDACKDFETGKQLKDRNAAENYMKLCFHKNKMRIQ